MLRQYEACASGARRPLGLDIPRSTLQSWLDTFSDLYTRVRGEILPRLKDELADQHTDLARHQIDVSRDLTERLSQGAAELSPRDLSGAIRNLDVGSGIHTQRAGELRGDPTAIVEHRSDTERAKEIMRKLTAMGRAVESEAEEIESLPELPGLSGIRPALRRRLCSA